jgi:hypothetical protein
VKEVEFSKIVVVNWNFGGGERRNCEVDAEEVEAIICEVEGDRASGMERDG